MENEYRQEFSWIISKNLKVVFKINKLDGTRMIEIHGGVIRCYPINKMMMKRLMDYFESTVFLPSSPIALKEYELFNENLIPPQELEAMGQGNLFN